MKVVPLRDRVLLRRIEEHEVKKGDKVLIGKFSGTEVEIERIEHVIIHEEEILSKIS
ncbi:MAG: hypothetical protein ACETWK_02500 [Candidatus Aminicenantaceae bacterium]